MASTEKSKRSTTIVEVSSSESRATSPLSVAIRTRKQEKNELANLNDRLAQYIQRNRELQHENNNYATEIQSLKESWQREINKSKAVCEKEIRDLRLALDEVSTQKAKLELDTNRFRTEKDEIDKKLKAKQKEFLNVQKKCESLETQLDDAKSRLNQSHNERKRLEDNINELNHDLQSANKQLQDAQRQLEAEVYSRVNLENQIQSLREELIFKETLHEQELSETRVMRETQIEHAVEEQIKEQYEQRLADELAELRQISEEQVRLNREELTRTYEAQLKELQKRLTSKSSSETTLKNDLQTFRNKVDSLTAKVSELSAVNEGYKSRIKDLEKLIEQERNWATLSLREKDEEMSKLRDDLKEIHKEYQDLLDLKIALDLEINAYRKMLEGEETRLSLSPRKSQGGPDETSSTSGRLATPRVYAMPRKRKRVVIEDNENTVEFKTFSDCRGEVQINDYDQEGKFVKLHNKSDQDISLSGWQLQRKIGEKVVTTYKFPRTATIKAGSEVTVWSSDSKVTHNPPSDILMKNNWGTGDDISTSLLNPDGEEAAIRSTTKVIKSHKFRRLADSFGDYNYSEVDSGDNKEKCILM
ncbi:lamin Dm0 [Tetranychus urticae]|uniref:Lamin n=1 Tax=Tetranychus urticae TaxID=32264 RepID=T1K733_TETUR|nr:lamin Dm0 [Tetranychus urticae]